ncbi:hypothetical protein DSECCO2_463400 [anaerobic digester metagenome]
MNLFQNLHVLSGLKVYIGCTRKFPENCYCFRGIEIVLKGFPEPILKFRKGFKGFQVSGTRFIFHILQGKFQVVKGLFKFQIIIFCIFCKGFGIVQFFPIMHRKEHETHNLATVHFDNLG